MAENYSLNDKTESYQYPVLELVKDENWLRILNYFRQVNTKLPILWSFQNDSPVTKDLVTYNSLLIVGPPAIGKTTFLNQLIYSLLFKKHPSQVKFILIDFKRLEFGMFENMAKLFLAKRPDYQRAVVSDNKQLLETLNSLCLELDNRFNLIKEAECKNIIDYNQKFVERKLNPQKGHQYFPHLILVIDELADLMISNKADINTILQRLVSNGYKVGIITIISTNQYLGDTLSPVLTSLIETRIVFRLNEKDDYRRFLNTSKVNEYLPKGTFLFTENGILQKGVTAVINNESFEAVIDFLHSQEKLYDSFLLPSFEPENSKGDLDAAVRDPLFEDAAKLIVAYQIGSTSLIQRKMKLGYNRAGHLMDQLAAAGIVGKDTGNKAREVFIKSDAELFRILKTMI